MLLIAMAFVVAMTGCHSDSSKSGGSPRVDAGTDAYRADTTEPNLDAETGGDVVDGDTTSPDADALTADVASDTSDPDPAIGELYANPSPVEFSGRPSFAHPEWTREARLVDIINAGESPVSISDMSIEGSEVFEVTYPRESTDAAGNPQYRLEDDIRNDGWPATLAPSESFKVRVWFIPANRLPIHGILGISSDDPEEPRFEVPLHGNTGTPCLDVSHSELAFGQATLGVPTRQIVTLENCSPIAELHIDEITLTDDADGAFQVEFESRPDDLDSDVATLAPDRSMNIVVTFNPTDIEQYTGEISIRSDDAASREKTLPLSGQGTQNECPTALASATLANGDQGSTSVITPPGNTAMLDGTASTDPDGDDGLLNYQWTILSGPTGSTQRLLPSASVASPRLFVERAGTYELELRVFDSDGTANCGEPALVTIDVVPRGDISIEVVWNSPSDPDQSDSVGTDLDLHYLRESGDWNSAPWDVHWNNPNPDWGEPAAASDNPSLDIDDDTGSGPERISHSGLNDVIYTAGVYYFSDRRMGAAFATLRIYVRGSLEFELENQYMREDGVFWRVAEIDGADESILNVSRMFDGFPNH